MNLATFGMMVVLLFSFGLRLLYIEKNTFDYDEGHWLMFGALAAEGHTPYTEIFVGIPPLALLTIQGAVAIFGDGLLVRLPMLAFSLAGIAALYALVRRQAGPLAGLLAASFLAFNITYFIGSTTLMTEVPAVALALLAILLVAARPASRPQRWLFLSGAIFAASLLLKVFVVFVPLIVLAQLAYKVWLAKAFDATPDRLKQVLRLFGFWLGGVLITIGPFLLIYNPLEMYEQVIHFRVLLREAKLVKGIDYDENLAVLRENLAQSWPLLTLGLAGGLVEARKNPRRLWLWLLWLGLAIPVLILQIPLRPRYFVMMLPPVAALSGMVVARLVDALEPPPKLAYPRRRRLTAFSAIGGLLFLQSISVLAIPPETHIFDREPDGSLSAETATRLSAAHFLQRMTAPDDCVIVDDQRFAFLANRLVPPFLAETSNARFDVGWLTTSQILGVARTEQCAALVFVSDRFEQRLPDLADKAASMFSLEMVFNAPDSTEEVLMFFAPPDTDQQPTFRLDQMLGHEILLAGANLTPSPWRVGQEISLSTYWQAHQKVGRDYKIFLHLRDAGGNTVVNFDHFPFGASPDDLISAVWPTGAYLQDQQTDHFADYPATGMLPTRLWLPGQTLKETITAQLPDTLPPGTYSLSLGMYDEQTGQRLPLADLGRNEVVIGPIEILP